MMMMRWSWLWLWWWHNHLCNTHAFSWDVGYFSLLCWLLRCFLNDSRRFLKHMLNLSFPRHGRIYRNFGMVHWPLHCWIWPIHLQRNRFRLRCLATLIGGDNSFSETHLRRTTRLFLRVICEKSHLKLEISEGWNNPNCLEIFILVHFRESFWNHSFESSNLSREARYF